MALMVDQASEHAEPTGLRALPLIVAHDSVYRRMEVVGSCQHHQQCCAAYLTFPTTKSGDGESLCNDTVLPVLPVVLNHYRELISCPASLR